MLFMAAMDLNEGNAIKSQNINTALSERASASPEQQEEEFPLASMGVLAPRSAEARTSAQPPINASRNFLEHVSAESPSNISPNPSEVIFEVSAP